MEVLTRRALGGGTTHGLAVDDRDEQSGRGVGTGVEERAALSAKLDTLTRWARRRDDPTPAVERHPNDVSAARPALERKLVALDQAAASRETHESGIPGTMTQEEFWQNHPDEYIPPDKGSRKPDVPEPFRDPRDWIGEINPEPDAPGRDNNCGECARATELSWRGVPAISAAYADPDSGGENDTRMMEWSHSDLRPASLDDIGTSLAEAGDGAPAVIAVGWRNGGGHWFNAVNHKGEVLAVDGQSGTVARWPPTEPVTGVDKNLINESLAISFDRDGRISEEQS